MKEDRQRDGRTDRVLDAASPAVYHGHNVGEVQAFYHHLHEVLVTAGAGHKLLQRELACQGQRKGINARRRKTDISQEGDYFIVPVTFKMKLNKMMRKLAKTEVLNKACAESTAELILIFRFKSLNLKPLHVVFNHLILKYLQFNSQKF